MKKYLFMIMSAMLMVFLAGCTNEADNPVRRVELKSFSNSGCKGYDVYNYVASFELKASAGNMLYVKHNNAFFNCGTSHFEAIVEAEGNSITINEYGWLDYEYATACMCVFDLGYEIGPLDGGKPYTIKINTGPTLQDSDMVPSTEETVFEIVYTPEFSKTIIPSQDKIDPALLEQTKPEFTNADFREEWTSTTNGTWTIYWLNGVIGGIIYGENPSPSPHQTIEDFFNEYLPLTDNDDMIKDGSIYRQYYKGLPVERATWQFIPNNMVYGHFVPINNLDIIPTISEKNAKKIVENYIKESVEGEDKCFYLALMEFPAGEALVPRLVYVYKHDPWEEHNYVYVDAKTGRILYQIIIHGGKPYN